MPDFSSALKASSPNGFDNGPQEKLKIQIKGELRDKLLNDIKEKILTEFRSSVTIDLITELKEELQHDLQRSSSISDGLINGSSVGSAVSTAEPPPSIFTPICHPLVEEAIRDIDSYYLEHWGFAHEKARNKFVAAGFSRVTCLYFPKALDERIRFACSLLTILFLIDDQLEDLSFKDGAAYNESLMPLMRGDLLPDRRVPVQWMMYDLWENMRRCDRELAVSVLEPVFRFMRAQTSSERLSVSGLGRYLTYRQDDVGQALLAALMRFSMGLHLTAADFASVTAVEKNCGRHISVVNDIYSYEKELLTSQTAHKEGGVLCSAVPIFANEADVEIAAAKNVLYTLCREWEKVHGKLVQKREAAEGGCKESVRRYMGGIEYHMSGNELWSRTTKRYHDVNA